jgi:serine/threonine protein kinase
MEISKGSQVLGGRYTLLNFPLSVEQTSQSWVGADAYDRTYLLKLWPFKGENPEDFQRALWDKELRTLYRVGSSPGADETILVIRDAGVDREYRCFVMVMELHGASGYMRFSDALRHRAQFEWLSGRDARARAEMWYALQRIADGLRLLHLQDILHRQVGAESVFFDPQQGPRSARLGGFEWSVRLGVPHAASPPRTWSTPPEFFGAEPVGYRPETDWYAFGVLAARCLLPLESLDSEDPLLRNDRICRMLVRNNNNLSDRERDFMRRLVAPDARDRLSRGFEIRTEIQDIITALEVGYDPERDERPLILVINPASELANRAVQSGFAPDPNNLHDAFNPGDPLHVARLKNFVQSDLINAQLYLISDQKSYLAVGQSLCLLIVPYQDVDRTSGTTTTTWDIAFCANVSELRKETSCTELPPGRIVVCVQREIRSDRTLRQKARNWQRFLPARDWSAQLQASLSRFHEFLRFTNQLELLLCDAVIFRYRIVQRDFSNRAVDRIAIEEIPRDRPVMSFLRTEGGLIEFLQREKESGKPECNFVVLCEKEEEALKIAWRAKTERWEIDRIDTEVLKIWLSRSSIGINAPPPPDEGNIRAFGIFGQVSLIERRKKAIDRLQTHSYLLRSLSATGQVYMDTGPATLPVVLPVDEVDVAKQAAMQDILRVRPIYALQGPPGTGKTTLVAHLLRQFFQDDPVSQILITAQAHGAVDVLRRMVRDEAFRSVSDSGQPLAVRLGKAGDRSRLDEGSVDEVALRIMRIADAVMTAV